MKSTIRKLSLVILLLTTTAKASIPAEDLIITVEQTSGTVGFYNPDDGTKYGRVKVGFNPHEVIVSKDQKTAYVSNFGLQDYDETIGVPGLSISVIDIPNRVEKFRLYTVDPESRTNFSEADKAPHGIRLRPPFEKQLYVNVEKGSKILVFDIESRKIINKISVNQNTHNFIFSPDGRILWVMAGKDGVIKMDPDTGAVTGQFKLATPVRGIMYTPDNKYIMASGMNEIALFDPHSLSIQKHFKELGVGQILYSDMTPDGKYIVAPAVWNSQAIIINTRSGKVVKRIVTGNDPVTVKIDGAGKFAYVTNARNEHITQIDLTTFQSKNIDIGQGPNGLAIAKFTPGNQRKLLTLAAPLPLTGQDEIQGREMMLGYEFWLDSVNKAGGIMVNNVPYDVKILYLDTQSKVENVSKLAEILINKYQADILLGTYGIAGYNREKQVALNNNVPIAPLNIAPLTWQTNNLVGGEDIFSTQERFADEFQRYYNVKAPILSAIAAESGIVLQQALLKSNAVDYDELMTSFSEQNFNTFLSAIRQAKASN